MSTSSTLPRQQARRQGSVKQAPRSNQKKNSDHSSSMLLSPEHSPYDPQGFSAGSNTNHLALSHPNLEDLRSRDNPISKQPPAYEVAVAHSMQGGMPGQQPLEGQYSNFHQMQHNRQQSMPASVAPSNYSNHLSPPHSNLSSHHVQSPPHSTGAMSPPNPAVMSPPQSVTMSPPQTSQHSMSPPQQQPISSQQHLSSSQSPAKSRSVQLPTSPTHLAALRGATHQRHQMAPTSFDFPPGNPTTTSSTPTATTVNDMNMYSMSRHAQFLYPTPPQEQLHNNSFSPDSPDQWSSASPQSHSDWSDGIHSPPAINGNGNGQYSQQQAHHQHQHQLHQMSQEQII